MKIGTEVTISAAHFVHTAYDRSPCRRLHGHNWRIVVELDGKVAKDGMVVDYTFIKDEINELDHRVLVAKSLCKEDDDSIIINFKWKKYILPKSDVIALPVESVTSENLAKYLADRLSTIFKVNGLMRVYETPKSYAEVKF